MNIADELNKIRAKVSFIADSVDSLLEGAINDKQPLKETLYGLHLVFMDIRKDLDLAACQAARLGQKGG
jgi:hypothetical protein